MDHYQLKRKIISRFKAAVRVLYDSYPSEVSDDIVFNRVTVLSSFCILIIEFQSSSFGSHDYEDFIYIQRFVNASSFRIYALPKKFEVHFVINNSVYEK